MENKLLFDGMYDTLKYYYKNLEGNFFTKSENYFGSHPAYLMDTPHGYWEFSHTDALPPKHSQRFLNSIKEIMMHAEKHIDITNLGPPSGEFLETFIEALIHICSKPRNVVLVRILCGRSTPPGSSNAFDTKKFIDLIKNRVPNNERIELHAAHHSVEGNFRIPLGWNHSKYIAVDGEKIILGGHNWIGETYLGINPVFDISIRLDGPIAKSAHKFSNYLWTFINKYVHQPYQTSWADSLKNGENIKIAAPRIPWSYPNIEIPNANIRCISVAQPGLGLLDEEDEKKHLNPSATAMYYAMRNAKNTICLSQQDLGGMGIRANTPSEGTVKLTHGKIPYIAIHGRGDSPKLINFYDYNLITSITENLANNKNLDIRILLSNIGAKSEGGTDYSYGAQIENVFRAFGWFLIKKMNKTKVQTHQIIKDQIRIHGVGFANKNTWHAGPTCNVIGNHSKYWSVDDEICYIGSHNMYPTTGSWASAPIVEVTAHLQEWGVVLGNKANEKVKEIREDYFEHMFKAGVFSEFDDHFLDGL